MVTAVIIDDEKDCIADLVYLIEKHQLPVEVVATAASGQEGLVAILKHKPNLVFLDIVMPEMSGFEMLDLLPQLDFQLIISTSEDKYAIQAIRASALDFLLKPVKTGDLKAAVERAMELTERPTKSQTTLLSSAFQRGNQGIQKIALNVSDGIQLVAVADVLYFESDGNYTNVHFKDGTKMLVTKQLGKFEEMLDAAVFFRIHNSYLVNLNRVSKFIRADGGYIVLDTGQTLSVARNRKDDFLEALSRN